MSSVVELVAGEEQGDTVMSNKKHIILGVHITNRVTHASAVQKILSAYGCHIRTRLGLHDVDARFCSPNGLILLEVVGKDSECLALIKALKAVKGVQVQKMMFSH
jgi:hypothetical protein